MRRARALSSLVLLAPACLVQRPLELEPPAEATHEIRRSFHPGQEVVRREWRVRVGSDGRVERDGFERTFYASGAQEAERFFARDRPAGTWRSWYEDGRMRSEVEIGDGERPLPMRFWHRNGQLAGLGEGLAGVREGEWTYWNDDGQLAQQGSHRSGLRTGLWTFFAPGEVKRAEGRYEAGRRVGEWTLWDAQGQAHVKSGEDLPADEPEPELPVPPAGDQ